MRRLAVLVVVFPLMSAAFAGCLSQAPAELVGAAAPATAPEVPVHTLAWTEPAAMPAPAPEGTDALFASWDLTLEPPMGTLTLTGTSPSGDVIELARVTSTRAVASSSNWRILPAEAGEWTFAVEADRATTGALNVSFATQPQLQAAAPTGEDRVVLAVVDTGVNPYHNVFKRDGFTTADLPARIHDAVADAAPVSFPVSRGTDYADSVRRDTGSWAALPGQTLVHFAGTNVLGYHLDDTELPALPVLDRAGHGTAVLHAAVNENPDVVLVLITGGDYDAGVRWAAEQPWIDIISLSWGPPANAMGPASSALFGFVTPEATKQAYQAGKVVFSASGNDPTPTFSDTTSGPIWAHAVAGSYPGGKAGASGHFVDTVANFTQDLADHDDLGATHNTSGTSFATPLTAGVASRILHEVRVAAGHVGGITDGALVKTDTVTVTNGDLRSALNATAVWFTPTDFDVPPRTPFAMPVTPVAPWLQQGWGHVDGRVVMPAAAGLLGTEAFAEKDPAAVAWMQMHHDLREQYWS